MTMHARLFGHDPYELDRAIHRVAMRAVNRQKVRDLLKEVRFYRAKLETPEVLYSTHCSEWEDVAAAIEADMWSEFWSRNEV